MTTAIAERRAFSIEPITYPVIEAKIAELSAEYMPLRIDGLNDAKGLKTVHEARMVVKNLRVAVEKRRKELKASALEYGREVDTAAKALFDLLEPIESHLTAEEDAVENEKKRIKQAEEDAKRAALQKRLNAMLDYGVVFDPSRAQSMTDEAFAGELAKAKEAFDARKAAEAEAAKKRAEEEAALKAERERLAEIKRQQDEEAARIRQEQHKLELAKATTEAAEKARIETEQRLAREAEQKRLAEEARIAREKADADAKEAARLKAEAERPQREKLAAVADAVDAIEVPAGPGADDVSLELGRCAIAIRKIANGPLA